MSMLVRIYPPNKSRGYYARRYRISGSKYPVFDYKRGWYEVDSKTAKQLKKVRNNPADPMSRPVFQVVTREQAVAIEEAEKAEVAKATGPVPLPAGVEEESTTWPEDMNESKNKPAFYETAGDEDDESDDDDDGIESQYLVGSLTDDDDESVLDEIAEEKPARSKRVKELKAKKSPPKKAAPKKPAVKKTESKPKRTVKRTKKTAAKKGTTRRKSSR